MVVCRYIVSMYNVTYLVGNNAPPYCVGHLACVLKHLGIAYRTDIVGNYAPMWGIMPHFF